MLQYASGHTQLCDLVKVEIRSARDQAVAETRRAEGTLRSHITSEVSGAERSTADRIAAESRSMNEHVTLETSRAETALKSHLAQQFTAVEESITSCMSTGMNLVSHRIRDQEARMVNDDHFRRLLRSLKYPAMNERRNQVSQSHTGTFQWILGADGSISDDDNSFDDHGSAWDSDSNPNGDSAWKSDCEDGRWDHLGDWLKSDNDIYWISGKPGSGKSTLVKFLVDSPQTRAALDIRRPGALIVSHFFWKPGSLMQNSIKGLLCSLLYQAISPDPAVVSSSLPGPDILAQKDSYTDWSVQELESTCLAVFASHPSPICVFIDGLDEVHDQDGAIALMGIVDRLRAISTVKLCVASRPEPRFLRRLQHNQHLRLHDLTLSDMRKYTRHHLAPYLATTTPAASRAAFRRPLPALLVDKAKGVFLWLHLATCSLIRGLDNGDHEEELARRLASLPSELSSLYRDMWMRLNEDTQIYRQATAFYFNLVVDARSALDIGTKERSLSSCTPYNRGKLSLFHFMVATQRCVQTAFLNERKPISASCLSRLCAEASNAVHVRCAGLVEIAPTAYRASFASDEHAILQPYLDRELRFIHRTAYDFLVDTEQGREIRAHDPSSETERKLWLVCGHLVETRLCSRVDTPYSNSVQRVVSFVQNQAGQDRDELLRVCWEWYDSGNLTDEWPKRHSQPPHFLVAAARPELEHFIRSSVLASSNPPLLAKTLLRDLFCSRWLPTISPAALFDLGSDTAKSLQRFLLSLGADARIEGYLWNPCASERNHMRKSVPCTSLSGRVLQELEWCSDQEACDKLVLLVESGAALDERFPLLLRVTKWQPDSTMVSLVSQTSWLDMLSDNLYGRRACMDWHIWLDVNAAFVIGKFCRKVRSRRTLRQPGLPYESLTRLSGAEAPTRPLATVALVVPPTEELWPQAYRLHNKEVADKLMAKIDLWVARASDKELVHEIDQTLSHLAQEIEGGSEDYSLLDQPIPDYLAEIGCGFCFVDEEGNRVESLDVEKRRVSGENGDEVSDGNNKRVVEGREREVAGP